MKRDYVRLLAGDVANLTISICDIAMRGTVKTIAAHLVSSIELIRNRVEISALGEGLMKCSIKYGNLWETRTEQLARGLNALYVCGIVQRCKLDAIFNAAKHLVRNKDGVRESFASVHHSMSDGIYISDTVNDADGWFGCHPSNNEINSIAQISESFCEALLCLAFGLKSNDRLTADTFDYPACQAPIFIPGDRVEVGDDQLKLDARASAVKDQDVHRCGSPNL